MISAKIIDKQLKTSAKAIIYGVVLEVTKSYDKETNDIYNKLAEEKK